MGLFILTFFLFIVCLIVYGILPETQTRNKGFGLAFIILILLMFVFGTKALIEKKENSSIKESVEVTYQDGEVITYVVTMEKGFVRVFLVAQIEDERVSYTENFYQFQISTDEKASYVTTLKVGDNIRISEDGKFLEIPSN